jgi:trimeric autotransporter adhesin
MAKHACGWFLAVLLAVGSGASPSGAARIGSPTSGGAGPRATQTQTPRGVIHTVAGSIVRGPTPATSTVFGEVNALAASGSLLYVATGGNVVRSVDLVTGAQRVVAGNGGPYGGDGGLATQAGTSACALAATPKGVLFISDCAGHRIRRVNAAGIITTVVGTGEIGFSGEGGPATRAKISDVRGLALSPSGDLYLADRANNRVERVDTNGIITTIAGAGTGGDGGPALTAQLQGPWGLAFAANGDLYVAEDGGLRVRKISQGIISTVAGNGTLGALGDGGQATSASLEPQGISVVSGDLLVADRANSRIRRVDGNGLISTVAGSGNPGFDGDGGPAVAADLHYPADVTSDAQGNLYVADTANLRVRAISTVGTITTIAGNGRRSGGEGFPARQAQFDSSFGGLEFTPRGDTFIANDNRVDRIDGDGLLHAFAGTGDPASTGDGGPALNAQTLGGPLAVDAGGDVYIGEPGGTIRKVDAQGVISHVAGNGAGISNGDGGPATSAGLAGVSDIAFDSAGNLLVVDEGSINGASIRKIDRAGTITTIAGRCVAGNPQLAFNACIHYIQAIAVDAADNIYVITNEGTLIRRFKEGGTITTIAGDGTFGYAGDGGPATAASFIASNLAVSPSGTVYFTDWQDNRVQTFRAGGNISTFAGNGGGGTSGDGGKATDAQVGLPWAIAVAPDGSVCFFDTVARSLRCALPAIVPAPPRDVHASVSGRQVSVSWSAPSNNGSEIAWYVVTAVPGGKRWRIGGSRTDGTFDDLGIGTFRFKVRAINAVGAGAWSSVSNAATIKRRSGYWLLAADGLVYPFGDATHLGDVNGPAVAIAPRRDGRGYWTVDSAGKVHGFGTAQLHGGSPSLEPGEAFSTIAATPSGNGYWLFTTAGRAMAYGDAQFHGDLARTILNGPIVASIATPTGHGYYMVATDGGVFTFGDARFHGSTGDLHLNAPVVGISPTPDNAGYWLVASDGGVFAFDAPVRGSMGATHLNKPVKGLGAYGDGYLMVANDGGVFDFSNTPFVGSLADNPRPAPILGIAAFTS